MARSQVNPLQAQTDLQPQAGPVNSYVQPQAPSQTNDFLQLANGLSRFSDKLDAALAKDKAKHDRLAEQTLKALALKDVAMGREAAQALKDGTITSDQQELYTYYHNAAYGNRVAIENGEQVLKDLNNPSSEYYSTPDIENLLLEKRQAFFQNLDPVSAEGALDEWTRTERMILEARRKVAADNLQLSTEQNYAVMTRDLIRKGVDNGIPPDRIMSEFQNGMGKFATTIHGIPNSDKNKWLFSEVMNLSDEALLNGQFDKAEQFLNVLTVSRPDSSNPSQTIPPVATGELGARVEAQRGQIAKARSKYEADIYDKQQRARVDIQVEDMARNGQLFNVQDQSYQTADGSTKTVSRNELIETATNNYLVKSEQLAKERNETPEQRIQREADWFSNQGVVNPYWKGTLQSGYKAFTTSTTDNGVAPQNASVAFHLYRNLSQTAPLYLNGLLDEQGRQFYETADVAMKYLRQDENQALNTAYRAVSNPAMRGRSVSAAAVEEKITSASKTIGANSGTLKGAVVQLANTFLAAGLSEEEAIDKAVESTRKNTVVINGWSVFSNNSTMPPDFKARAERYIDDVWTARWKDLEADGVSKEDLHIVNLPNDPNSWLVITPYNSTVGQFGLRELQSQILQDEANAFNKALDTARNRKNPSVTSGIAGFSSQSTKRK